MTQHPAPLHKLLLVGTARARAAIDGLAPELAAIVQPAIDMAATPERQLWLAAGAERLWSRAGYAPPAASAGAAPSAPEQMPPCPRAAAAMLARLLGVDDMPLAASILKDLLGPNDAPPLLLQWLQLLNAIGARLPERFLPNLLDLATRYPALRPGVRAALGTRGAWLLQAEPAWSWAQALPAPERLADIWHNGERNERMAALQAWRASDPAAARAALQSGWAAEPPENRTAFLPCLGVNLAADDEPFLEAALDDRRKGVRVVARQLLARLPGSALSQRMRARAHALLQLDRDGAAGPMLTVTLPAACDSAMERDGIGESKHAGLGEKTGWLADMLAAIDPAYWSTRFALTPDQWFALAAGSGYAEALLLGWTSALALHLPQAATPGTLAWLAAWTRRWLNTEGRRFHSGAPPSYPLYLALPPATMHAALFDLVQASGSTWTEKDIPLLELLQHLVTEPGPAWPAALSGAIVQRLLGGLAALEPQHWALQWGIKALAVSLDPAAVLEEAGKWPDPRAASPFWQSLFEPFFHVVRFRHEMISSFQEPA